MNGVPWRGYLVAAAFGLSLIFAGILNRSPAIAQSEKPSLSSSSEKEKGNNGSNSANHSGHADKPAELPTTQKSEARAPPEDRIAQPNDQKTKEDGTEFWPTLIGARLKITDTLIVFFTALLFWATLLLWGATRRLVADANETSKKQLRAYLFVSECKIGDDYSTIRMIVKNAGQTPAKKVRGQINTFGFPVEKGMPDDFAFSDFHVGEALSEAMLGPSQCHTWGFTVSRDHLMAIKQGTLKVYIYGWFKYIDVFDKPQSLTFCYEGFTLGDGIGRLIVYSHHNDST